MSRRRPSAGAGHASGRFQLRRDHERRCCARPLTHRRRLHGANRRKEHGTGLALAEIYDASASDAFVATTPRLINVSARTQVGVGGGILITGFSSRVSSSLAPLRKPCSSAPSVLRSRPLASPVWSAIRSCNFSRAQGCSAKTTAGAATRSSAQPERAWAHLLWRMPPAKDSVLLVTLPQGSTQRKSPHKISPPASRSSKSTTYLESLTHQHCAHRLRSSGGQANQGLTAVPSRRRTGSQYPGCAGSGYFLAFSSSKSTPQPGASLRIA
jgi:hypothetical protein